VIKSQTQVHIANLVTVLDSLGLLIPLTRFTRSDEKDSSCTHTLRVRASAEDGGADADFGGAFLDGDFEVVGHAHGEDGERQAG
jgi:hypothetical protein